MNSIRRISIAMACLALTAPAVGQSQTASPAVAKPLSTSLGMVVFPAKGQAAQVAAQPTQAAPAADGSRLRGAARGAAAGAVIGEVANNDAGQGAAVGATGGVVAGGRQSRKNQQQAAQQATQQQQQATEQQQGAQQQQVDLFRKGFAACLEPKGYTVK